MLLRKLWKNAPCLVAIILPLGCAEGHTAPEESRTRSGPILLSRVEVTNLSSWEVWSFTLTSPCLGLVATGSFEIHVRSNEVVFPDGTRRFRQTFNIAGGRLSGPDGEVIIQQNGKATQEFWADETFHSLLKTTWRSITRGPGNNEETEISIEVSWDGTTLTVVSVVAPDCRGSGTIG